MNDVIRIGVTGHREFDDVDLVASTVDVVLDRVLGSGGGTPVVVSSLAEGADRVVTERVLARAGAQLAVVLPLAAEDYETDFASSRSCADFRRLLALAVSVVEVELKADETREAAYERAGRVVVDRSDVLIALWDGAPSRGRGGTAEIVQYALDTDVSVEVVLVRRGAEK